METKKVSKYEEQRLANMKRNADMLASLNIQSTITHLNALSKPPIRNYTKKPRTESHVVRTSLRCRGIAPQEIPTKTPKIRKSSILEPEPIKMRDAFVNTSGLDDCKLIETILGVPKNSRVGYTNDNALGVTEKGDNSIALDSFRLGPQKIARFFQGKIFSLRFLPSKDKRMIVVGGDYGNLGFWDVDSVDDGDRMYVYRPHSAPVSGIVFQHFSTSKIFTSSYDGCIRLMDVERETFDLAYYGSHSICSLSQRPNDVKSLYFGEAQGKVNVWDETAGKSSSLWSLHEGRINSIDFNAHNTNIMATSSSDRTACIWDLRKVVVDKPEPIITVNHKRPVYSAFFSPSGSLLATTSIDHTAGLLSGANYNSVSMLCHTNWLTSPLRGSWGWDDQHIFIGNVKGGIDAISTVTKKCIDTLRSPEITAVPRLFEKHPANVGMLAGVTSSGLIFTSSCDGCIRLMNVERETIDLAYHGAQSICSLSQRPNDVKSLYFGEGQGKVNVWDDTAGKSSSLWSLHEGRINSINFNAHNTTIMATSSHDRTACIWGLRKVAVDKPEPISSVNHKRAVHSAFFSPSGSHLATTSIDHTVGLLGGANYDSVSMLCHTNGLSSPLRGSWGWDDRYIFIGNMKGGIDAISTVTNRCIDTLRSPEMTAIPRFFEKHPANVGMLAGVTITSTGLVYLWTPS